MYSKLFILYRQADPAQNETKKALCQQTKDAFLKF